MSPEKKNVKAKDQDKHQEALPNFETEFGEWFNAVLFQADIIDYRYNLKGCGVWKGYGFKLRQNSFQIIRNILDSTPVPHEEMLFPLLVPEDQFMKEAETVKGFEEEVYWVKDGGTTPLDVKLALRPTSETVMYPMAAKWIRSHQDLPLKTYQIVNTFRFEGKNTRPLIRVREITTFKEAHTYHETAEKCQEQIREAIDAYREFFDSLAVPYIVSDRPKWDTFPGAKYTIAFDCIFPDKHKTLQIGTIHNLGQTFSKSFNISFETIDGKQDNVYQTCYGISERAIAAIIASHGDVKGIKMPPMIAPIQIVIVPIIFKKKEKEVMDVVNKFYKDVRHAGLRVNLDTRNMSTGRKYYHWEIRGVPIRVEIGPRDVKKESVAVVRRDTGEKQFIPITDAISRINEILNDMQDTLWESAKSRHQSWIYQTQDLEEALDWVDSNKGIVEIPFCGSEDCAKKIEQRIEGLKFLGVPDRYLSALHDEPEEDENLFCAQCMEPVKRYWRMGRTY